MWPGPRRDVRREISPPGGRTVASAGAAPGPDVRGGRLRPPPQRASGLRSPSWTMLCAPRPPGPPALPPPSRTRLAHDDTPEGPPPRFRAGRVARETPTGSTHTTLLPPDISRTRARPRRTTTRNRSASVPHSSRTTIAIGIPTTSACRACRPPGRPRSR